MRAQSRNHSCRIHDNFKIGKLDAVVLESEKLRITVAAGRGADVVEFLHKPDDLDLVWLTANGLADGEVNYNYNDPLGSFIDEYPGGWQTIVDYLNSIGYKVVVIHQQANTLDNVIDKTGNIDIMDRAIDLYHADFMIGIGSGVSWLAWALEKPVIMISGFSAPSCEFSNKNYRVINQSVCNGCFNDVRHKFDRGDWNWCPRLKNTERMFECTTKLSPQLVIEQINLLIQEQGL